MPNDLTQRERWLAADPELRRMLADDDDEKQPRKEPPNPHAPITRDELVTVLRRLSDAIEKQADRLLDLHDRTDAEQAVAEALEGVRLDIDRVASAFEAGSLE